MTAPTAQRAPTARLAHGYAYWRCDQFPALGLEVCTFRQAGDGRGLAWARRLTDDPLDTWGESEDVYGLDAAYYDAAHERMVARVVAGEIVLPERAGALEMEGAVA